MGTRRGGRRELEFNWAAIGAKFEITGRSFAPCATDKLPPETDALKTILVSYVLYRNGVWTQRRR